MRRVLLIINPISGTLAKEGLEERVRARLKDCGFALVARTTEYAGHGAEMAEEAVKRGYYAVIAAGGDGTVNEIAAALRGTQTALGILPFGSGNGLARHLYGSIDVDKALDVIALDSLTECDCGTANGQPFFCTFGLGFDAKVSKEFSEMPQRGLVSYIRSAVQEWVKYSPVEYEISTGGKTMKVKAFIVAVCNASQYGNNAYIAPKASIHDGLLDITVIHAGNPLTRAIAGVELFTGRIDRNILIQTLRVKRAVIRHSSGVAHIDGDPCTLPEEVNVECEPGRLLMFTDPEKPPFRPFLTLIKSWVMDSQYLVREYTRITWNVLKRMFGRLFGGRKSG